MQNMSDGDWNLLLGRIKDGRCTPFLGAGACAGVFPLGSAIARDWAQEHGYPLQDAHDLARVAQYVAVTVDALAPKEKIQAQFQRVRLPDFTAPNEPHGILADLPIPVYMTTNYDDCMAKALESRNKVPRQELCHWNTFVRENVQSVFEIEPGFSPTPANPLVFHLHGHLSMPESMVLTEDDYLDFLVNISRDSDLIPARVRRAMTATSLLFLGYRLADWDFRVLFRGIVSYVEKALQRVHVAVQLVPGRGEINEEQLEKAQEYLVKYFDDLRIRVYWGTCQEFVTELRHRWKEYNHSD
jgi:hypothetical protein